MKVSTVFHDAPGRVAVPPPNNKRIASTASVRHKKIARSASNRDNLSIQEKMENGGASVQASSRVSISQLNRFAPGQVLRLNPHQEGSRTRIVITDSGIDSDSTSGANYRFKNLEFDASSDNSYDHDHGIINLELDCGHWYFADTVGPISKQTGIKLWDNTQKSAASKIKAQDGVLPVEKILEVPIKPRLQAVSSNTSNLSLCFHINAIKSQCEKKIKQWTQKYINDNKKLEDCEDKEITLLMKLYCDDSQTASHVVHKTQMPSIGYVVVKLDPPSKLSISDPNLVKCIVWNIKSDWQDVSDMVTAEGIVTYKISFQLEDHNNRNMSIETKKKEEKEGEKKSDEKEKEEMIDLNFDVTPAMKYVCGIGQRFQLPNKPFGDSGRHVTVTAFNKDGTYSIRTDNNENNDADHFDPTPFTAVPAPIYRYEAGTQLILLLDDVKGSVIDDTVVRFLGPSQGNRHEMSRLGLVDLNCFNHAVTRTHITSSAVFKAACLDYLETVKEKNAIVQDAITGKALHIQDQVVVISTRTVDDGLGLHREGWSDIDDILILSNKLSEPAPYRQQGIYTAQPILIHAGPGSGKSWTIARIAYELAQNASNTLHHQNILLPLVIPVQRLAMLEEQGLSCAGSLVTDFIRQEYEKTNPQFYDLLIIALQMRTLMILVDGIDEAADLRNAVEREVVHEISWTGMRIIVTSRPEGVNLKNFQDRFVLLTLEPLSYKQMIAVADHQMEGDDFFNHLLSFSKIRNEHDLLYRDVFPSLIDRKHIETWNMVDRFYKIDDPTSFDPAMRQKDKLGEDLKITENPVSKNLVKLNSFITPTLLGKTDQMLIESGSSCESSTIEEQVRHMLGTRDRDEEDFEKVIRKLAVLVHKLSQSEAQSCSKLWPEIMSRTDSLYQVAEEFEPHFRSAVTALLRKAEYVGVEVKWGGLKDPVRVYEKARDDYADRFLDVDPEFLPESCVVDVIRARVIFDDCKTQQNFLQEVTNGIRIQLRTKGVYHLEPIRAKNKYAMKDPTHFRNILLNLRFFEDGEENKGMFVELQLHQKRILKYNEESHAHSHYDYFRSQLAASYEIGLDSLLVRMLEFFDSVCRNPVQYSILIKVLLDLKQRGTDMLTEFPATLYDLYDCAIKAILRDYPSLRGNKGAVAYSVLQHIAVANMLTGKRLFSNKDAIKACSSDGFNQLSSQDKLRNICATILGENNSEKIFDDPPLLKTLNRGPLSMFQFRHLSLQESLFVQVQATTSENIMLKTWVRLWESDKSAVATLSNNFFDNSFKIGGDVLGRALTLMSPRKDWCFHLDKHMEMIHSLTCIAQGLAFNAGLRRLEIHFGKYNDSVLQGCLLSALLIPPKGHHELGEFGDSKKRANTKFTLRELKVDLQDAHISILTKALSFPNILWTLRLLDIRGCKLSTESLEPFLIAAVENRAFCPEILGWNDFLVDTPTITSKHKINFDKRLTASECDLGIPLHIMLGCNPSRIHSCTSIDYGLLGIGLRALRLPSLEIQYTLVCT